MNKYVGIRPAKPTKRISAGRPAAKRASRPARKKRQLSEVEREQFFALSPDMLCIAGGDGYFRWVNPAFTKALGWSAAELMAKPFATFVHPDDRAGTQAEVTRQIEARERVLSFENRYRHKDGSWRALS